MLDSLQFLYEHLKIFSLFKTTYSIIIQYMSISPTFSLHVIASRSGFLFGIGFGDGIYNQVISFVLLLDVTAVRPNMAHSDP
jgi:hypothetical protein